MSLTGKRIAITGAFGSLGAAVVQTALAAGARVAAIDRADEPPAGIDLGAAGRFGGIDLADADQAKAALDEAAMTMGGLDALVNIAGTFRFETLADG
ncbi:MAG TPA: SDR family NAD(P)-dependent oxidoreductase, partial [Rhodanobacteraceae bacterium]|nr:SDR family NAD(P)-dependent oxidoreductase [Rhodanobacteraceae bacterium]